MMLKSIRWQNVGVNLYSLHSNHSDPQFTHVCGLRNGFQVALRFI